MMRRNVSGLMAAWLASALTAGTAMAADQAQTCEASKLSTIARYAQCRLKAESQSVKTGDQASYSKCSLAKFASAEEKAGGFCPTSNDQSLLQNYLDAATLRAAALLAWGRFTDNGDGTITDNKTGLMWEKKTGQSDSTPDYANPHDVDNLYSWAAEVPPSGFPGGSVFTDFLDKLNGWSGPGTGFAGHYDWRLPTREELEGIKDISVAGCALDSDTPCISTTFGPTLADRYWTSTTSGFNPEFAFVVLFAGGGWDPYEVYKPFDSRARAVRSAD